MERELFNLDYDEPLPDGLWHGALEGNWIIESRAWSMLWRRVGYRNDCTCRSQHPLGPSVPIHYRIDQVIHPRWRKILLGDFCILGGEPAMRSFNMERECSGRFTRTRTYLWKPDVERWVEWYARHIAEEAEKRLGGGETYKEIG